MLEHLFGSKTRIKLLQLFFAYPERSFFVRELSRLVGVQLNAVRREIVNLEKVGLIGPTEINAAEKSERCKYFQLQTACILYPEFKDLMAKVQIFEEREFVEELKKRAGKIKFLLLTGYFTGDKDAESDLLIVGAIKPAATAKIVRQFEKNISRELRYTVMTEQEFKDRREIGDKFLYGLLETKHLVAIDDYRLIS
jgi:predicted transcriptional regulator